MKTRGSRAGFTLVEVVLSMVILVLVVVGMYRIMAGAFDAAAEIQQAKARDAKVFGLIELCRSTFARLPSDAAVETDAIEEGGRYFPLLRIRNAPLALAFGPDSTYYGPKSLAARPQIGGLWNISLVYEPEDDENALVLDSGVEPPPPVPLVADVRNIEWRFFDESTGKWSIDWDTLQSRPRLLQMALTMAGEETPYTAVFWLPRKSANQAGRGQPNPEPPPAP